MGSEGALVKRIVLTLLLVTISALAHAEVRWCTIRGKGPNDKLVYPDIARMARVFGVVKARIEFLPGGRVRAMNRISGSPLLFSLMKQQMVHWTMQTDARGDEPCQAIVVTAFDLDDYALWRNPKEERVDAPSVLRIVLDGESFPDETIFTTNDPVERPYQKHPK